MNRLVIVLLLVWAISGALGGAAGYRLGYERGGQIGWQAAIISVRWFNKGGTMPADWSSWEMEQR